MGTVSACVLWQNHSASMHRQPKHTRNANHPNEPANWCRVWFRVPGYYILVGMRQLQRASEIRETQDLPGKKSIVEAIRSLNWDALPRDALISFGFLSEMLKTLRNLKELIGGLRFSSWVTLSHLRVLKMWLNDDKFYHLSKQFDNIEADSIEDAFKTKKLFTGGHSDRMVILND